MKNNFLLIATFFIIQFSYSQFVPRVVLKGKIVAESLSIDNVTVFNISSNKGAISDHLGYFTLYARPSDTLVFSSVVFKSKKLILAEIDFKVEVVYVKLEEFINELDEVVVTPKTLTGDLVKDVKNIKVTDMNPVFNSAQITDLQFEKDASSTPKNPGIYDGTITYGMDFVKIGKMIGKIFVKDKPKEMVFTSSKNFQEAVKDKFTYNFFTETLELNKDEIGLFLAYCDSDPKVKELLAVNREIDLIDFLISKSKEYKNLPKD
jgi:hypothetical protein